MGYEDMAHLTHSLENVLDAIRNEEMTITSEWMDVMFEALDDLEAIVLSIIEGGDGKRDVSEVFLSFGDDRSLKFVIGPFRFGRRRFRRFCRCCRLLVCPCHIKLGADF